MIIEKAHADDFEELKQLWSVVFDEEPAFLEHFFSKRFSFDHIVVAREDGTIVSALHALPCSYQQHGKIKPCAYIVGAATYQAYRKRGIMGKLLAYTKETYTIPITLFPAVRPFYEANGYITTSNMKEYALTTQSGHDIESIPLSIEQLDEIFCKETAAEGALLRDRLAWESLLSGYELYAVKEGYALVKDHVAVETLASQEHAAKELLQLLHNNHVKTCRIIPNTLMETQFSEKPFTLVPMGMSTDTTMAGIYIAEQY